VIKIRQNEKITTIKITKSYLWLNGAAKFDVGRVFSVIDYLISGRWFFVFFIAAITCY
jgi:hypothetical protein